MLRDPENIERNFIRKTLGPSAGVVLEIGCGDGRLTADIASTSGRLLGLDPDPESIEKARHLEENGVTFVLASGDKVPLTDNSVDTVVFSLSLHHHPDPRTALFEARRVLRESGRILVLEPEAESPINRLFRTIHNEDDAYKRAMTAIDECGMEIADQGTYGTIWRFEDFDEMVNHLFSYFELEPDPESTDRMEQQLGDQRGSTPLDLEDITRHWMLRPVS